MGILLSLFDRGSFYANYEKAFAKLEKEETRVKKRSVTRIALKKRLTRDILYVGAALTLCFAVYASWVFRQETETFTPRERILRLSLFVVIPLFMTVGYQMLLLCFDLLTKWDERILKKLNKSRGDMLKDIKDRNRYEKILELLQKYDPEEQKKAKLLEQLKQPQKKPNEKQKSSIGGSIMTGAGKVIDSLANGIIGDQPELLAELKASRSMLHEMEKRNEALMQENERLKATLSDMNGRTECEAVVDRSATGIETSASSVPAKAETSP